MENSRGMRQGSSKKNNAEFIVKRPKPRQTESLPPKNVPGFRESRIAPVTRSIKKSTTIKPETEWFGVLPRTPQAGEELGLNQALHPLSQVLPCYFGCRALLVMEIHILS